MRYLALIAAIGIGITQGFTPKSVTLIIFVLWSIPLTWFRLRFRQLVYQETGFAIAIKPVFVKEIKAVVGNIYPDNPAYLKTRNWYRFYLLIFICLYILWRSIA